MDDYFTVAENTLYCLIRSSLFNIPFENVQDIDWDELFKESKLQTITALIADCVPEDAGTNWKTAYIRNLARNVRYLNAQKELICLFQKNNIPLVILKGTAAAIYYPEPLNRAMGDIDLIVPQELYENACCLMIENGYLNGNASASYGRHKQYTKGKFTYELHHHFSDDDLNIEHYIVDGFQQVKYRMIDGVAFPMLPKLANGLVLLVHLRHHLKSGIGLRQVIDWMMYVDKELDDLFWENDFREEASKVGLEKLAVAVTRMCQIYLGLSERITWCHKADDILCQCLMVDIFVYGNFGKKHGKGVVFEKTVTNIQTKGLFQFLQKAGEKKFTLYHRHRWLKPFCWIYQVFYLLKKSLKYKRGTKMLYDLKQSNKRYDLLKQLDII